MLGCRFCERHGSALSRARLPGQGFSSSWSAPFAVCFQKVVMSFAELNLSESLRRAVGEAGYEIATPIQAQAIPHVLAGRDLVGCAQTGTGKTAAFALPILDRLHHNPSPATAHRKIRVLVLCPTRELATQIGHGFKAYGREVKVRYSV